jgi:hypothetical protein
MTTLARKIMDAPAVAGGAVARDGVSLNGYEVLQKDWSAAGKTTSDTKKFTFAAWFEIASFANSFYLASVSSSDNSLLIGALTDGSFYILGEGGALTITSAASEIALNTKYFVMAVYDSAQGTAANRLKIWFGPYGGTVAQKSYTYTGSITLNQAFSHGNSSSFDYIGRENLSTANGLSGKMADVYWLDGVALSSPSSIVDSYASNAKPASYSGSYGNTGYHLDFDTAGSLGADTSGNANDFTLPQVGSLGSVLTVSTYIGSGTGGGGRAAAFDGTTNQAIAASASLSGNNAIYVGADFGSGTEKRVYKAEIWGSNDSGYVAGSNPSVTLTLRSNTTAPGSATAGTSRGTTTFTDTANESGNVRTITSSNNTTAIRYWHIATGTHNANKGIAEIKFYESTLNQITSSNQVTPYL